MNNLENLATAIGKDIKDIKTRFATKEEKHEAAEIDYSQIVTHDELEGKHYLTAHQSLAEYAKKSELYNDLEIKARIKALESKSSAPADASLVNTQNNRKLTYWAGTQAQYDAIPYKNVNTIYDIFK